MRRWGWGLLDKEREVAGIRFLHGRTDPAAPRVYIVLLTCGVPYHSARLPTRPPSSDGATCSLLVLSRMDPQVNCHTYMSCDQPDTHGRAMEQSVLTIRLVYCCRSTSRVNKS